MNDEEEKIKNLKSWNFLEISHFMDPLRTRSSLMTHQHKFHCEQTHKMGQKYKCVMSKFSGRDLEKK